MSKVMNDALKSAYRDVVADEVRGLMKDLLGDEQKKLIKQAVIDYLENDGLLTPSDPAETKKEPTPVELPDVTDDVVDSIDLETLNI